MRKAFLHTPKASLCPQTQQRTNSEVLRCWIQYRAERSEGKKGGKKGRKRGHRSPVSGTTWGRYQTAGKGPDPTFRAETRHSSLTSETSGSQELRWASHIRTTGRAEVGKDTG